MSTETVTYKPLAYPKWPTSHPTHAPESTTFGKGLLTIKAIVEISIRVTDTIKCIVTSFVRI